jgi:hypothetical protein
MVAEIVVDLAAQTCLEARLEFVYLGVENGLEHLEIFREAMLYPRAGKPPYRGDAENAGRDYFPVKKSVAK